MGMFSRYKPYLKEFNYPNIAGFTEDQIADVFSTRNRCVLLTWLIKAMNSQFAIPSEWSDNTETLFADFFHDSGFCTSSQKYSFVRGDANLSTKEQLIIFDRIFDFLANSTKKENDELSQIANNDQDIELFLKKDINLFPALGPLRLRTSNERQSKMKQLKQEIEKLLENIKNGSDINNDDVISESLFVNTADQIEQNIQTFREQAKKLQEVCTTISKENKTSDRDKLAGFDTLFQDDLKNCHAAAVEILQYFTNVNLAKFVNAEHISNLKFVEENEMCRTMKQHALTSSEVVKTVNTSACQ